MTKAEMGASSVGNLIVTSQHDFFHICWSDPAGSMQTRARMSYRILATQA